MDKDKKDLFYLHGRFFDNEDEFFKFAKEWPNLPWDENEFRSQLNLRMDELRMNNMITPGGITNRRAYQILRLCTDWAINTNVDG